jgi:hypothetical protein
VAVAGSELNSALGNEMKPGMIADPVCPRGVNGKRQLKPSRVVSAELRLRLTADGEGKVSREDEATRGVEGACELVRLEVAVWPGRTLTGTLPHAVASTALSSANASRLRVVRTVFIKTYQGVIWLQARRAL